MDVQRHLNELDEQGFTLLPGFTNRETTAAIREYIDRTLREGSPSDPNRRGSGFHHRICHPMEDPITVRLANDPALLALATTALRAENLRLRQQMFMLTLPCDAEPPARPDGWHIDTPFSPEEWNATPRKVFLQVFTYCSPVDAGGAATMVIPRSHHKTYAAVANCATDEERRELCRDIVRNAGVDPGEAIEVLCEEGDTVLFNPMMIHSGSNNVTDRPRYAFHCSFHDASAERIRNLSPIFYDQFPDSMVAAMPEELRPLLER
jgi:ectoine hydroxylase-related dioxygenase (phytanoyl-CoA dioxygenase family)